MAEDKISLYYVERSIFDIDKWSYGHYRAFYVYADDKDHARTFHPNGKSTITFNEDGDNIWSDISLDENNDGWVNPCEISKLIVTQEKDTVLKSDIIEGKKQRIAYVSKNGTEDEKDDYFDQTPYTVDEEISYLEPQ